MKNIVLIGFMGSGKTTTGKLLSIKLNKTLLDIDSIIETNEGMKIRDIFERYGEPHFRDIETHTLKSLVGNKESIVSTGGGIVVRDENLEILKILGTIVYLKISEEILLERLKDDSDRPLLASGDFRTRIHKLMLEREERYESISDISIEVDKLSKEEVVKEVIKRIQQ